MCSAIKQYQCSCLLLPPTHKQLTIIIISSVWVLCTQSHSQAMHHQLACEWHGSSSMAVQSSASPLHTTPALNKPLLTATNNQQTTPLAHHLRRAPASSMLAMCCSRFQATCCCAAWGPGCGYRSSPLLSAWWQSALRCSYAALPASMPCDWPWV